MPKATLFIIHLVVLFVGIFFSFLDVSAQPIWLDQSINKSISLEALKPIKKNTHFFTSTHFLSVRLPLAEQWVFVGELPFSYFKTNFSRGRNTSDSKLGNPYLGIEFYREDSPLFIEAGFRLPLVGAEDNATRFGQLTDADRLEAFAPDAITVLTTLNFQHTYPSAVFFRLRSGPSILFSTGDGGSILLTDPASAGESEVFLVFSGQLGYAGKKVNLSGGLTGRLVVTEEGDFGRRTYLQLGLNARFNLGNFRPGVHVTIPLEDDLKEVVDLIVGVNFGLLLR